MSTVLEVVKVAVPLVILLLAIVTAAACILDMKKVEEKDKMDQEERSTRNHGISHRD